MTTAFRWTLAIAGSFTAMALFLFGFIYWQTAVHERQRIDGIVAHEASVLFAGPLATLPARVGAWLAVDTHGVRYAGLFAPDGGRSAGNLLTPPQGLPGDGQAHRAELDQIDLDEDGDSPEVVRAVALHLDGGSLLVVGYDIDELEEVQDLMARALGLGLLPMVLLSFVGGTILASRAQRRIAAMHVAVGQIMRGQLNQRLPVRGTGDDLDRLAATVNEMVAEIERLVEEIRGVGDSIAHDLRTPLTRVRTRLERSRDEIQTPEAFHATIDRAIGSVDQALAVVSAILRIGEIEHGRRRGAFGPVDLAGVLHDAAELYEPLAEEKGVTLKLNLVPAAAVVGDRDLLLEAVGNVVDNAIKFAPAGTEVVLSLDSADAGTRLRVSDQGLGIPPHERERVLQRFYRAESSRTIEGSGLGLNLVSAVVALHGFHMQIGDANPGCVVEIVCPVTIEPESIQQRAALQLAD